MVVSDTWLLLCRVVAAVLSLLVDCRFNLVSKEASFYHGNQNHPGR
jgi:hypothetical protein